jgi:hypothetical protein
MKRTLTSLLLLGALLALGPIPSTPAASSFVTSAARLAIAPTPADSPCGSLTLGGTLNLVTQVTSPTDPCQAQALVHGVGVLQGSSTDGRRYYAVLSPSWTQTTACLGGRTTEVALFFRLQPNGTPFSPVDPCKDAVLQGTLHLAFTATGQIDASSTFVDLGGGGGDVIDL